ncbi:MAG: Coenzyme F420 hydrogenase/dehydrogenase, beta subunit C-terminal domain [Candidatus Helarchaeota archaeon]|nr:Coenzyme F420 hydrogenase/dehydrogenase, beta subunit C-terminal domain [Candidatus Helarchaeota archaeon]
MSVKIFEDLQKEVISQNLCNLCGACLAVCTANDTNALCIENNKPQYKEDTDKDQKIKKCLECGICYLVCGQIPLLNAELGKQFPLKLPLGTYRYLSCARTKDAKIQEIAQDGGVVTTILKYLLEKKLIDGAVVNYPIGNWKSIPQIISSPDELIKTAGTRYLACPSAQALGNYKTLGKDNPRLAFVGTPCQVQTIRKMQLLKARPGIFVKYVIGLFCMENFDYERLLREKFEKELKINLDNIKKLNIKGKFLINLKNNEVIEIPLKDLAHLVRTNCNYCVDFTNFYADISVGGIGSPAGYSTILVRTGTGSDLFSKLLLGNEIEELNVDPNTVKKGILAQISKLGQMKYDKGIKNKSQLPQK